MGRPQAGSGQVRCTFRADCSGPPTRAGRVSPPLRTLAWAASCCWLLVACRLMGPASVPGSAGTNTAAPPIQKIQMRRSGCFGPCPIYEVELTRAGKVTFDGEKYVAFEGSHTGIVTAGDFTRLSQLIDQVGFISLHDRYSALEDGCKRVWTDNPYVEIVVTRARLVKRVVYYYGCEGSPAGQVISDLSREIDDVAKTAQWIRAR